MEQVILALMAAVAAAGFSPSATAPEYAHLTQANDHENQREDQVWGTLEATAQEDTTGAVAT